MKTLHFILAGLILFSSVQAQNNNNISPCSEPEIILRHLQYSPDALQEIEDNELLTAEFIQDLHIERVKGNMKLATAQYTIPVVLHVFHWGDNGKIDMTQAQSGIDILNTDYNGLNSDWNTIDPEFDSIKGTLDIQFCLASLDPNGDSTTGVMYYEDSLKMLNIPDLFVHAWDNYKYLNIYMPKYTSGTPSNFTAYAYYPSTSNTNNNTDGIFYSSIRWGYGTHSELTPGQDWASVGTHEVGHWLNLRHTFENGCNFPGDYVDDTPYTTGGVIELSGCLNNNLSCSINTNGENYMDYNHDCKKMFTQDQTDRMTAALSLPSRINLWSAANLVATGCAPCSGVTSSFTTSSSTVCIGETVTFTSTSTGSTTNTWLLGTDTISTSAIATNTFNNTGSYTVMLNVVDSLGECENSSVISIIVNTCVGISNLSLSHLIAIYPNPTQGIINFKFDRAPQKLFIYDAFGRLISDTKIGSESHTLNTNQLENGIYFYRVVFESEVVSGQFIVD